MLTQLVVLGVLVEAVTELTKDVVERGFVFAQIMALLVGQLLAWGSQVDLLAVVGVVGEPWLAYVGITLTGLIVSRGANYVHTLWDRLGAARGN